MDDNEYMRMALALARRGLGRTAPNPSVGCMLVKKNMVVGRGWTGNGGRPHAETIALAQAGSEARGATAYVTLEPCAHHGKTGPCAEALVKAGIARAVIACIDPNPQVLGKGIEILKQAGVEVVLGVLEEQAVELNRGFFLRFKEQRPLVTLKMAVTHDGMIVPASGKQEWITGKLARRHVHLMRSQHDAVLTAIGTIKNDNPMLTTRLEGITHKAPRIILDEKLETPLDSNIVRTVNEAPVWISHTKDPENKAGKMEKAGVRLFNVGYDLGPVMKALAQEGITRLFFEGGGTVLKEFVKAGLCDQFLLYRAPNVTWPGGTSLNFPEIRQKLGLERVETRALGEDLLEIYGRKA